MTLDYSVGDFISVGALAWNVYKSCKEAPESYVGNIALEVLSLHAALKEAAETVFAHPLSLTKQEHLKALGEGCYRVLKDLDDRCKKYQSLGIQNSKRPWGMEDIAELRARLTSNTALLTAWIRCVCVSSEFQGGISWLTAKNKKLIYSMSWQAQVEKKLKHFSQECRDGKREGSVISAQTSDPLSTMNDKQLWCTIRKELEDIGITVAVFDANKDFIFEWFANAIANGAFKERTFNDDPPMAEPSCEENSSDDQSSKRNFKVRTGPSNAGAAPLNKDVPVPLPQEATVQRPRIPRVAALIARLTRPNQSLITAAEECISKACEILNDRRKVLWLGKESSCMAIIWAASRGDEQVVRLLIEKGADVNACDADGNYALHHALENGHEQVARLLIEKGADVTACDANGNPALHYASNNGDEQVVRLLIEKEADVNACDAYTERSALHFASRNGHKQVVRLLVEQGANVNIRDATYKNPALHYASNNGHEQVVRLLIEKGADVNACDADGNYALHYASKNGHTHVVRLLIEKGADIDAYRKRSALQYALENGHEQVVRLLIEKGASVELYG